MGQAEKVLKYLKDRGNEGATAKELTDLYIPQYNWCIMHLRRQGHVIDAVRTRMNNGRIRWRFFYRGDGGQMRRFPTPAKPVPAGSPRFTMAD